MRHTPFKVVQNKILLKTGILILSLAAAIACGTTGAEENRPDIPGKIVFSAQDGGDDPTFQIFTMNADGSDIRQLTDDEFSSSDPAWSPDGQQIAFATARGAPVGSDALWVMDADGSNQRPLVFHPETGGPMFGNQPAWNPDGTKLAFDQCIDCEAFGRNHEIFLANLQTGTIDTLAPHPAGDGGPKWSPEGTSILFQSGRACDASPLCADIFSITIDGKDLKRVTFSSGSSKHAGGYNWLSPDSISYILSDTNTDLKDLIVLDLKSGEKHPVLSDLDVNIFWTIWDPAGRQFLSIEKKHNEVPVTLTVFNLNGNTIEEIMLTDPVLRTAVGFKWKVNQ